MTIVSSPERATELSKAIGHHMEGRYDEAERIYLTLHEADKHDEEVLYLIGVLCCDLGIYSQACRFLEEALKFAPTFPEAARRLLQACKLASAGFIAAGDLAAAETALQRALALSAEDADAWRGRGQIALLQGQPAQAQKFLEHALRQAKNDLDSLNWHGLACLQQKKYALALPSLQRLLQLKPDLIQGRNNLGLCQFGLGQLTQAEGSFLTALQYAPDDIGARINLANTLRILGRAEEARQHLEQVLAQAPDSVDALNNLGTVLQDLGRAEEACDCLKRALAMARDSPHVRWNLALSQLLLGDFAQGWRNFEARWEGCAGLAGAYDKPPQRAWHGEPMAGKTILLWAEQGFGDTLQFIRFAATLAERGVKVIVEVQPELKQLAAGAPGVSQTIVRGQPLPDYDFHCPLMSLPFLLENAGFGNTPYLHADAAHAAQWRSALAPFAGRKVGLVWAGKSRMGSAELDAIDRRRSMTLAQLAPLTATPGHVFFSLQKGAPADELAAAALPIHDFSAQWKDFSDTAAFIANLDLVISVDTSVAHLAGAMGKPVWLLNRFDTCWRWGVESEDSPWYPELKQFRQRRAGDWDSVIAAVAAQLQTP